MEMFIRVENGQPVGHPILADNVYLAFPNVDVNSLPPEFARFERVPSPNVEIYQVAEHSYVIEDGIAKDSWTVRGMSAEEVNAKQEQEKDEWARIGGPASWIFVEQLCAFHPPVPRPNDGKKYVWDEGAASWVEVTFS